MSARNGTGRAGSEPGSPAPPLPDHLASSGASPAKELECWCVSQQGDGVGGGSLWNESPQRSSQHGRPHGRGNGDETEVMYVRRSAWE